MVSTQHASCWCVLCPLRLRPRDGVGGFRTRLRPQGGDLNGEPMSRFHGWSLARRDQTQGATTKQTHDMKTNTRGKIAAFLATTAAFAGSSFATDSDGVTAALTSISGYTSLVAGGIATIIGIAAIFGSIKLGKRLISRM